jgi:hypothetical protein
MTTSNQEKAKLFLDALTELHESLQQADTTGTANHIKILEASPDVLQRLVQRVLDKQVQFEHLNICNLIDVGFHYTKAENMERICTDGLLTLKERTERKIASLHNGSSKGDGIYTCDDHLAYRDSHGPVGLIVARLTGNVTFNHREPGAAYMKGSLVVLRNSAQCVPLIQFTTPRDDLICKYQSSLLSLVSSHFNSTALEPLPVHYQLPFLRDSRMYYTYTYTAPDTLDWSASENANKEPQGNMPSGTMSVQRNFSVTCMGYPRGAFMIYYRIDDGIQKSYHW